ncbi:reprolysin-like metallopeptidase [Chryseobacterium arthrosphaerae]|uniref:Propanediol utilization protein n=1 Tax=Chryseobacterium arthrosphaerae TaxID=651561 RepID=A0A1B8ZV61_9FLAO|nr:zinc-dependent metalloprotease family protein [Chryseobacterium arthrosphaerae]OCA75471.1 propanediol utilization protein [Chryseobacterium arthrosphaerae]
MKKLLTTLMCALVGGTAFAQWTPTSAKVDRKQKSGELAVTGVRGYYKLDLDLLRSQLSGAQEMGKNAKPVVISIPTLSGKIEKFNVYSFPVVVKSLADRYQLGSYVGASIDDPSRTVRFSVSPRGFNSMIMQDGQYEFIDPQDSGKTVYGVHPKTIQTGSKSFVCTTNESPAAVKAIDKMLEKGKSFTNQVNDFSKMSDKKYRTMRLAMSVTAEYAIYHGGNLQGAVDAISTTMTRVNGVFEKDFALHLNVQDLPGLIFFDPATDPYSDAADMDNWNVELQQTLTNTPGVGNGAYDIGHLFGASGGGGNAGCIGCVCINPTSATDTAKGSGFTSPANGQPEGDAFDIDYVAHEMGHQLGANHTFSHGLESSGVNVEPGSGSTIMGYAGITGANTDVQANSDAYFHTVSIRQVQTNLLEKTCDIETPVNNNPPVIAALPTYSIPKATAFVLTASATDPENDPMTYTWEQVNNANLVINKSNLGKTSSGASFRSIAPSTSPSRYFPKFSSVLNGVLDNGSNTWESVSMVPRTTKFAVTVRDNNSVVSQQQTQYAEQTIIVKDDGPFRLAAQFADVNTPTPIQWIVANTNAAPYNVTNVKIDYTTDGGNTWNVLAASTPNDGSENFTFPASLSGQTIKVRVSAIGNVFYTLGNVTLTPLSPCSSAAPTNVVVSYITTSSASVSWMSYTGATYKFRYKKTTGSVWTEIDTNVPSVNLNNLDDGSTYEVQVATVCAGTVGTYSTSVNFSTSSINYCTAAGNNGTDEHISNVTLANVNNTTQVGSGYSNFTNNTALQINLTKGNTYPLSVTLSRTGAPDYDGMAVFIDFNRDGTFDNSERVLNFPVGIANAPVTSTVVIPDDAIEGKPLRMRVLALFAGANNAGYSLPATWACGIKSPYGEVEDYNVVISPAPLSTSETNSKNNGIQIYPNPATDVLNITKVSDKAAYKIYNAAGQLVNSGNINNGKVNVSALVKGGYIITIDDKGIEQIRSKFIKK